MRGAADRRWGSFVGRRGAAGIAVLVALLSAASSAHGASSTLVISEVLASPSPEWIEIHNVSSSTISLDGYKVTDEEGEDASAERVLTFPTGAAIPAGGLVTVGQSPSVLTPIGACPTFSWSAGGDGSCISPAMTASPAFVVPDTIGQLRNSGDEVLLLDGSDNVIDSVAYGNSTWTGFTPAVAPSGVTSGSSIERFPAGHDTDSAADWRVQPLLVPNGFTRTLTVTRSGGGAGSVTSAPAGIACSEPAPDCSELYGNSVSIALSAAASGESTFTGWTGCDSVVEDLFGGEQCHVISDADKNVTANFAPPAVVTVTAPGSGGSITGPGIACPGDCSEDFPLGTEVTLTAAASGGSTFLGWSGCQSSAGTTCTVSATTNRLVTPEFAGPATLTVTTTGSGGGLVTGPGISCPGDCTQEYPLGTEVALAAAPDSASVFGGWGNACTGTGGCNLTMSASRTASAAFTATQASPPPGDQPPADPRPIADPALPGALPGPPETRLTKSSIKGKRRTATFEFGGSGGTWPLTFECRLDKRKFTPCASPKRYRGLKPGLHTFRARAKDGTGAVDPTAVVKKFRIARR